MHWKYFWLPPVLLWSLVVGVSFGWNWTQLDAQAHATATQQGRDIFRMIEAMRLWNARHGGLYVIQSAQTPPNPYLEVPERDPVTTSGKKLTMVNPAYMTRQMAGTILERTGIRVHITSLKPINPVNTPDDWERDALQHFAAGRDEYSEIVGGDDPQLRYMAPLVAQEACLACHEAQGYRLGDIRGGISVSFSAAPLFAAMVPQKHSVLFGHLLAWLTLVSLTVYAMSRIRTHLAVIEQARAEQERLVEIRTGELQTEASERRQAESQLRHLVDSTSGGIIGVDAEGRCQVCNPTAARMLGLADVPTLHGVPMLPLLAARSEPLAAMLRSALAGLSQSTEAVPIDGGAPEILVEVRVDPIIEGGHVMGAVLSLVDATERQARQREVWRQANFDHLTGLANRNLFLDRLERALLQHARTGSRAAVLFLDLDGFKPVNDQYGHAVGDAVLVEVADRLGALVRGTDIAARFGGDEFVIGLTEVGDEQQAGRIALKVLEAIAAPYRVGEIRTELTASVGVAIFPDDQQSTEMLLVAADEAMYHAKQSGRATCCFYAGGAFRLEST